MPRALENVLTAAFVIVAAGATLDGMEIAKNNPARAENMVGRCFSLPRNITTIPKQIIVCAHVPGIWGEQALIYGRNP